MNRNRSNSNYYQSPPRSQKRSFFSGCLFRVLIVLIAAGGIYFWLTYQPSGYAADLAPAIASFSGEPEIKIKQLRLEQTPYGTIKQYSANLENNERVYFDVDRTGAVANFFRAEQPSNAVLISIEQARNTAINFASTHYPDSSLLQATPPNENLTGNVGSSNRFYSFTWLRQDARSGAYLPQMLNIDVNAQTGQVDSYSMLNEPVTISTIPAVDQQAAAQTALSALPNPPSFSISDIQLAVTTTPIYESNGLQALVWQVTTTAPPDDTGHIAGAIIYIDAQTGSILLIDPFV